MKFSPIFPVLALLIMAGCDSDSDGPAVDPAFTEEIGAEEIGAEETGTSVTDTSEIVQLSFAGATFVAVDQPGADRASGDGTVSFTDDTVTWDRSGLVETGSYTDNGDSVLVASFSDRNIAFEEDGFNLIWDSLSYSRTVGSQFDSQESMIAFLDGTTFNTIETVDSMELPECVLSIDADGVISDSCTVDSETVESETVDSLELPECVLSIDADGVISDSCTVDPASPVEPGNPTANGSLQFNGNVVSWTVGNVVSAGTYTFVNSKSFKANFPDNEVTVVVLDQNKLVIDSVVYHKDLSNQFDSQESLVAFLDGASYQSVSLLPVGETSSGTVAIGYWFVDFTSNTFNWTFEDVAEAGTVSYIDGNSFTAILSDRELTIEVEGDDILWDGVRYRR